jgi:hypothetical protein
MEDFYHKIKRAKETNSLQKLIKEHNGDINLTYLTNPEPIFIKKQAIHNEKKDSLEHIFQSSAEKNLEVAFTGIFNKEDRIITNFLGGEAIDSGYCDWKEGDLLEKTREKLNEKNKMMMNHTHPVFKKGADIQRKYGAICSKIYYSDEAPAKRDIKNDPLVAFSFDEIKEEYRENYDEELFNKIKKSGSYKNYGGDYCELALWSNEKDVSSFFAIGSPRLNQLGIFELKDGGHIIYHPWKIIQ